MRSQANSHRQNRSFKEGDWVWLRLQPYCQVSMRGRHSPKLSKRFFGPYKITKVLGPVAYEILLPPDAKIHPVFHISKLKPFRGIPPANTPALAPSINGTRVTLQPLQFLGSHCLHTTAGTRKQILVHWEGLPATEATREDYEDLLKSYPNLEDKVVVDPRSIDMPISASQDKMDPTASKPNSAKPIHSKQKPAWLKDFY